MNFNQRPTQPSFSTKELTYHHYKAIDIESFIYDIVQCRLLNIGTQDVDELAETYNTVLSKLLDKHAPIKKKTITIHAAAPWYSNGTSIAKKDSRKGEKQWRHSGLSLLNEIHIHSNARNHVTPLISRSKE